MDCLDGIKQIPDHSINCVVTDPPYFQGLTHNGSSYELADLNISAYFFKALMAEIRRVLVKDYSFYFFADWRGYAFYYPIINEFLKIKNLLVWDKGSAPGSFYTFAHELIIFATGKNRLPAGGSNVIKGIAGFSCGAKKYEGEKLHPTQKPVSLIKKLILDSTKEEDTVLDVFMGSGTTALAAKELGRKFIGYEIQEKYYTIAKQRLGGLFDE